MTPSIYIGDRSWLDEAVQLEAELVGKADWDESEHPRAKDGKFSSGGAAGTGTTAAEVSAKAQIKTPEFKKFFAGSVVRNEDGTPAVVWRAGEVKLEEGVRDALYFSGDQSTAIWFGDSSGIPVKPYYLNAKRIATMDDLNRLGAEAIKPYERQYQDEYQKLKQKRDSGEITQEEFEEQNKQSWNQKERLFHHRLQSVSYLSPFEVEFLKAAGFDAIQGRPDNVGSHEIAVFSPDQVLAADGDFESQKHSPDNYWFGEKPKQGGKEEVKAKPVVAGAVSPEQVATSCNSDEAKQLLGQIFMDPNNRNTAMFGGCRVVAEALLKLYPQGELTALVDNRAYGQNKQAQREFDKTVMDGEAMVQHYLVKVGEDQYLDGQGLGTLAEKQGYFAKNMVFAQPKYWKPYPATEELVEGNQQIQSPPGAAERFARFLKGDAQPVGKNGDFEVIAGYLVGKDAEFEAKHSRDEGGKFSGGSTELGAQAARFKPSRPVTFEKPIVGPSGASLVGYEWKHRVEEGEDELGRDKTRRVSDWEAAATNPETGRDIVHQFRVVTPAEGLKVVSSETVAVLLGLTDRASAGSVEPVIRASKKVAQLQMQRQESERTADEYKQLRQQVAAQAQPPIRPLADGRDGYQMGEVQMMRRIYGPDTDEASQHAELRYRWENEQMKQLVGEHRLRELSSSQDGLRSLDEQIAQAQRKLKDAVDKSAKQSGATYIGKDAEFEDNLNERNESDLALLKAFAEDDKDGVWRTINGRHVQIKDGETPEQAVARDIKEQGENGNGGGQNPASQKVADPLAKRMDELKRMANDAEDIHDLLAVKEAVRVLWSKDKKEQYKEAIDEVRLLLKKKIEKHADGLRAADEQVATDAGGVLVYHGTIERFLPAILKNGLIPTRTSHSEDSKSTARRANSVYVTRNQMAARDFADDAKWQSYCDKFRSDKRTNSLKEMSKESVPKFRSLVVESAIPKKWFESNKSKDTNLSAEAKAYMLPSVKPEWIMLVRDSATGDVVWSRDKVSKSSESTETVYSSVALFSEKPDGEIVGKDAEFESKHDRDEGGKFAQSGSGGSEAGISRQGKSATIDGTPLKQCTSEQVQPYIVFVRQPHDNGLVPEGWSLIYFMDSKQSVESFKRGEIDYLRMPQGSLQWRMDSKVAPIEQMWDKRTPAGKAKGAEHILGMVEGVCTKDEIFVDVASVRKQWRGNGMATHLVNVMREAFPEAKLSFSNATDDGKKFVRSLGGHAPNDELKKSGSLWEEFEDEPMDEQLLLAKDDSTEMLRQFNQQPEAAVVLEASVEPAAVAQRFEQVSFKPLLRRERTLLLKVRSETANHLAGLPCDQSGRQTGEPEVTIRKRHITARKSYSVRHNKLTPMPVPEQLKRLSGTAADVPTDSLGRFPEDPTLPELRAPARTAAPPRRTPAAPVQDADKRPEDSLQSPDKG